MGAASLLVANWEMSDGRPAATNKEVSRRANCTGSPGSRWDGIRVGSETYAGAAIVELLVVKTF